MPHHSVVIIGAGFGGLAVALELKRAGHEDFVVLERQADVGGVWCANTYPGAACDVPSEIYSFSSVLKTDWSRRFGTQPEIQAYLADVTTEHDLRGHLRCGTEVTAATWQEPERRWAIELGDGSALTADVLVCATGQLSRPAVPDLPGREAFAGAQFHSAEWEHDVELTGKRVAVVGGGASAVQVVPAIADAAAHVTVVQRSPMWIAPKYDWAQGGLERALMRLPGAARARHNAMWWKFESFAPLIWRTSDPLRRVVELRLRRLIRRKVGRELAARITPDYAFGCNRVLLSSRWYPTLAREDVSVVASGVERVVPEGLITADGTTVAADVVVWCTGFTPTEYLAPMRITGRDGADLRAAWTSGPEAYLGMTAPGFPNLFMSYGPNTGSLTNTITFLLERQAAYIRQAVEYVGSFDGAIEVRRDVHDAFNRDLQRRLGRTVFTTGCPGWYTTAGGKVTTVWPGSHVAYAKATSRLRPEDFHHASPRTHPAAVAAPVGAGR